MNNLFPKGTLSRIPPEVKIEIYRFVLKKPPVILSTPTMMLQSREPDGFVYLDTVLFRTSKDISREAMDVFYSEQLFEINLWGFMVKLHTDLHSPQPRLSLIRNVHFCMEMMMNDGMCNGDAGYDASPFRGLIRSFAMLDTLRNTLRLTLAIES